MLGKDGQQKGTDLREKRKTRLPFSPSPFWKPFNGNTQSPRSGSFIFKMAAMLQIPRVFPRVSCRGSAKAVQCPCPGPKIGDKSQQIPRYSPVCPRGHPPGMAADKCIILSLKFVTSPVLKKVSGHGRVYDSISATIKIPFYFKSNKTRALLKVTQEAYLVV